MERLLSSIEHHVKKRLDRENFSLRFPPLCTAKKRVLASFYAV
ncbi:hypothetical protein CDS [Salmonella enterica subsp. enterica serovar Derby]|nr:hypothetical protein CDS [Salmonella enterica subsp. enterica serovar Derby]